MPQPIAPQSYETDPRTQPQPQEYYPPSPQRGYQPEVQPQRIQAEYQGNSRLQQVQEYQPTIM